MNTDSDYRADQRESQRLWQQNNPDYWRECRRNNQEYREHNLQMQRVRDGTYQQPKTYDEIDLAKMDALQVEIIPFTPG